MTSRVRFSLRIGAVSLWVALICCPACYSADVVYLGIAGVPSTAAHQTEIATGFYGLSTTKYQLGKANERDALKALRGLRRGKTLAVIVAADVLGSAYQSQVLDALRGAGPQQVPVAVVGITADTAPAVLKEWSENAISGCSGPIAASGHSVYHIGSVEPVTKELSGEELAVRPGRTCALVLDTSKGQSIMVLSAGSAEGPVLARTGAAHQERFFAAEFAPGNTAPPADAYDQPVYQFSVLAPLMMFLRYAAGEHAWHSNAHFANLTIDDALLREPYGHVRYGELLAEMQRHNFHTTIAFIPWNFDRSEAEVVSLFRAHRDRFSICVHGDNHDHQEFPALSQKALNLQAANVRQALARMEKFQKLTGIPYDPVMVFPHSIGPEKTLGLLKQSNYAATANSRDIPLDAAAPSDPTFPLRPVTLAFANFPSLRRYSAEIDIPTSELAVDAFLGNPLLFYVHQGYFTGGSGQFDYTADRVNRLVPGTQWRGLGYIAEHLYFERAREDGNYDIKAFTSTLDLENVHPKDAIFFVEKEEDFQIPLRLSVDGQAHPYTRDGNRIRFELPVRAGMSRRVEIRYEPELDLSAVDTSKSSLRVAVLRYLSEFRDNVVSRTRAGQSFIRVYTEHESGANQIIGALLAFVALGGVTLILRGRRGARSWTKVSGRRAGARM